jgi:hypothetical protein
MQQLASEHWKLWGRLRLRIMLALSGGMSAPTCTSLHQQARICLPTMARASALKLFLFPLNVDQWEGLIFSYTCVSKGGSDGSRGEVCELELECWEQRGGV